MFVVRKYLLCCLGLVFGFNISFAQSDSPPPKIFSMAIIQSEFVFDKSNIKMAKIELSPKGEYQGLHIQLKFADRAKFQDFTKKGQNKIAVLVFDKKVLSSAMIKGSLSGDLLIQIPKTEAEDFLKQLAVKQQRSNSSP
jgi:preprotein translocase subunit SecD